MSNSTFRAAMRRAGQAASTSGRRTGSGTRRAVDRADDASRRPSEPVRQAGTTARRAARDTAHGTAKSSRGKVSRVREMLTSGAGYDADPDFPGRSRWDSKPNYTKKQIRQRFGDDARIEKDDTGRGYRVYGSADKVWDRKRK